MQHSTIAALLLAVGSTIASPAAAQRAMTTDDGLDMVTLSDVAMSPDGERVFYSQSALDWNENKLKKTYYMMPARGGEAYQFIGDSGGSAFQFSPDGRYLSFTRPVDKTAQLVVMRTNGGEALQLTKHKTAVGTYRWSADGSRIFFLADEPKSDDEEKRHKAGDDAIIVDEGPNGQEEGSWRNLWKIDLSSKEEERITDAHHRIGSFDVTADGRRVAFTARFENRRNQGNQSEIFVRDLVTGEQRQLTDNRAPESNVRWSPDDSAIAFTAPSDAEWELRQNKIFVIDPASGDIRLATERFEGQVSRFEWSPDGRHILFTGLQRTNTNVFRVDARNGELRQLTDVVGTLSTHAFSRDGTRMAYTFQDFDSPPDLYTSTTAVLEPVRLTNSNEAIEQDIALAKAQVVQWKSTDGLEIEGLLVLPATYREGERLPLLLHVHGGPAGVFTNAFRSSYHVWAGLGYAQLLPNVRGSSGYTDALLRGNMQDIGGGDYWDLMTGVDYVVQAGYADPERLGIRGWSYGGILGGWTITQTDRFKGASLGAMVSDWTSEYGPGFNHDIRLWYIGGTPWENPEAYRQKSALTHVASVTTPTLILHGMNDRTDTEQQSMMFFSALKDQGKTTRYIKFPREPHGFREPRHQRTRDVEEITWIQKHVRGIEWTPWERPSAEGEKKPVTTASR